MKIEKRQKVSVKNVVFVLQTEANKEACIFPDLLRRTIVLSDEKIQDYALILTGRNQMKLYLKGLDVEFEIISGPATVDGNTMASSGNSSSSAGP